MNTTKSISSPEPKSRSEYYDADEEIRRYEEETGKKITENAAQIIRDYAPIINRAYNDGLRDGKEG